MTIHRRRTSYILATASSWTPSSLNNNELWLDSSDASTLTLVSNSVSEWRDKSGNNRHATQSAASLRPNYLASEINGQPAIDFDGTDDSLTVSGSSALLSSDNTYSKAFVIKPDTVQPQYQVFVHDPSGPYQLVGLATSGLVWYDTTANIREYPASSNFAIANAASIIIVVKTNGPDANGFAAGDAYVNGTIKTPLSGTSIGAASPTGSNWNIGTYPSNTAFNYNGKIGEVLISSQAWSTTDRQLVEGYLAHKHGLPNALPSNHPYKNSAP